MGEKKAIALEKQYRKEISKGASSAIASKIGNISIYKEFEPWTYDWLHKQKIHARNTMITSAVLIAVGTVVGALSFLAPDNTESGTAPGVEAAISIISLFVGGGGVALIVSGGMYAVHSTRISKFHFINELGSSSASSTSGIKLLAVAPYFTPDGNGGGVGLSLSF